MKLVVMAVLMLLVALGLCKPSGAADPPGPMKNAAAARLQGKLKIDGKLDDKAWEKAPSQTGFERLLATLERVPIPIEAQTTFKVLYDDDNLYFGIRCNEPHPDKLVVEAARVHDAAMWSDDDVELFIDPVGDRDQFYQLAINSEGTQVDIYHIEGGNTQKASWSSVWQTATFKGKDFWSVEIVLPFALFHNRPSKMWADNWVFSMSRTRSVTPGNYWSQYSPGYGYADIKNFGQLQGIKVDKTRYNLYTESPSFRLEPAENGFTVYPTVVVENRGDQAYTGTISMEILAPDAKGSSAELTLKPNASVKLDMPAAFVKEAGKMPVVFRIAKDKKESLVTRLDKWLTYTPLEVKITEPNYRNMIYATQKIDTIKGKLVVNVPVEKIKGSKARVSLVSSITDTRSVEVAVDSNRVAFELSARDLPIGNYIVRAEILASDNQTIVMEKQVPFAKLASAPNVEARVDDQGNLLINGVPVFIRGWYGSMEYIIGASSLTLAQLPHSTNFMLGASESDAANTGLYYLGSVTQLIDEAKAKLDQPIDNELKAKVLEVIAQARADRNIIGYYISDEPECRGLSAYYLQSLYEFIAANDPYRLCLVVSREPAEYMQTCDVMCPHPYMDPKEDEEGNRSFGGTIRSVHSAISAAVAANDGSKLIWSMPQTFNYGGARGRNPNFNESRWFAYTSIANGAKGLVPFIFNAYWNHLENRIAMDSVFEDLTLIAPAWLERDSDIAASSDNPNIDIIAKRAKVSEIYQSYIVAANQTREKQTATFEVPALAADNITQLLVVRENRIIPVTNGKFTDTFEDIGAHMYTTCEVLPYLKTVDQLRQEITTLMDRSAKAGNLLADKRIKWSIGEYGMNFSSDDDLVDGVSDAAGWLPVYGEKNSCMIVFQKPVTFSRVEVMSPNIKDADLQIWENGDWKTIYQWKNQLLYKLEYAGAKSTTDKLRILVVSQRTGHRSRYIPEITELSVFE